MITPTTVATWLDEQRVRRRASRPQSGPQRDEPEPDAEHPDDPILASVLPDRVAKVRVAKIERYVVENRPGLTNKELRRLLPG